MTDKEQHAHAPRAGEGQRVLETVALLLHGALTTATRQPFRSGRSALALRLLLVHHDVRNRLPVGHRFSSEAYAAARSFIESAVDLEDSNARVVQLLEAAQEVLADLPDTTRLSEVAIEVSDLLSEAKSPPWG
ncbi:hypothetical protein ACFVDI_25225 [Nocardioides sp. NPDC057767]|uniref:hypothetical protein n=1 Tax=unclassified Nocardioides TaxID=2615069 RepID=UPI00366D4215